MQKECNPDTENKSNENLEKFPNTEIEGRSTSSSFNCLTPAHNNQIAVNKYEDRFDKTLCKM